MMFYVKNTLENNDNKKLKVDISEVILTHELLDYPVIPRMKVVPMKRDRDLCDPNFGGYKLSLEGVAVQSSNIRTGPRHVQPNSEQYSFLHAKLYGEHNHLVADSWSRGGEVYFVSGEGSVVRVEGGQEEDVWVGESGSSRGEYNRRLMFISDTYAVVSDGGGVVSIIWTGRRGHGREGWKTVFSDAVCGRDRPCVVVSGEVAEAGQDMGVVVQYVEERDKVEGVGLPKDGSSVFLNVFEWINFKQSGTSWMMDRVRRVVTQGGVNSVGLVKGRLVLSTEKKAEIVFDSMTPMEEEVTEEEMEKITNGSKDQEKPKFYWRQSKEDVEVWLYGGEGVVRSMVKVVHENKMLDIVIGGVQLVQGKLWADIENDSWTWTLEGGKLGVIMCKKQEGEWPEIWGEEGGTMGEQVTDLTEDTFMANMTTENPIVSTEDPGPSFNSEQLEECDTCENIDMLLWFGGEEIGGANLAGHQHLFTVQEVGSACPALCTRHDVDGLVWRVGVDSVEHIATFPAMGYVQASKTQRKFVTAPPSFNYSVISDNSRHLYLYRQPESLAQETELRNRKSGQRVEKVARQQVITLDTTSEIMGVVAMELMLMVLTQDKLYTIQI